MEASSGCSTITITNVSTGKRPSGGPSPVAERQYNLVTNNCEHFAHWCCTGRHLSVQSRVTTTTAVLLGARGGMIGLELAKFYNKTLKRTTLLRLAPSYTGCNGTTQPEKCTTDGPSADQA